MLLTRTAVFFFFGVGVGEEGGQMCRVLVFSIFFTISSFTVAAFRAD